MTYADRILLSGEDYCPHNCQPGSDRPGYIVELAEYIFKQAGHEVEYIQVPWTRALKENEYGKFHGIVGAGPAEAPGFVFPSIKQGIASHRFYTHSSSDWQYSGHSSLSNLTLGVIQDYSYGEFYYKYIEPNISNSSKVQVIRGLHGLERNIKKLAAGRIDALIEDKAVINHQEIHTKLKLSIREAGIADIEDLYIAFSPNHPKSLHYAKLLTDGMTSIRNNGVLEQILSKYKLSDWESSL